MTMQLHELNVFNDKMYYNSIRTNAKIQSLTWHFHTLESGSQ